MTIEGGAEEWRAATSRHGLVQVGPGKHKRCNFPQRRPEVVLPNQFLQSVWPTDRDRVNGEAEKGVRLAETGVEKRCGKRVWMEHNVTS